MELWSKRTVFIILIFIILLGTFLRIYNLDKESFWTDEAFSIHHAKDQSISEVITDVSKTEAAPPLYYILLHYWINRLGDSEFAVRSMSALFGILSIIILFFTVRLFFSSTTALLSCLFLATSMLQVLYSQEARIYSLFTFLSLLCTYFFARIYLAEKNNISNSSSLYWFYGVSLLAAFYTNYMAFFLVIIFTLILYWQKEVYLKTKKKWFVLHLFLIPALVPLLYVMIPQFLTLNSGLASTLMRKSVPSFLAPLGLFLFVFPVIFFILLGFLLLYFIKYKDSLPSFLTLLVTAINWFDQKFHYFVLFIGLLYLYISINPLSLVGIPIIRTPINNPYFLVRHSFFLVPLWYVYLGYKIDNYIFHDRKRTALICFLIVLAISSSALYEYYTLPTKTEWREAMSFIQENSRPPPLILLDKGGFSNEFLLEYYFKSNPTVVRLSWSEHRQLQQLSEEEVLQEIGARKEFWLVLSKNPSTGYFYRDLLDKHYTRDLSWEGYQIKVYKYSTT